jgi:hypothetical protein
MNTINIQNAGSLKQSVLKSLSEHYDVIDFDLVNCNQAYAICDYAGDNIAAAFYIDIIDNDLVAFGGYEHELKLTDVKKLCKMPKPLIDKLDNYSEENTDFRSRTKIFHKAHTEHLFKGAILHSDNPPDAFKDNAVLNDFIVTHPSSVLSFDLDGKFVEVSKILRGYYKASNTDMLEAGSLRKGKYSLPAATKIMLSDIHERLKDEVLTARILRYPTESPSLIISKADSLKPVCFSKERSTFDIIASWGEAHNKTLGVDKEFLIDNSTEVEYHLDQSKLHIIKEHLKVNDQINEFMTPSAPSYDNAIG